MKKLICFVISVLLSVQMLPAFAQNTTEEIISESNDILFARTIGIFDETVEQAMPLTRAQLASVFYNIIMNVSKPSPAVSKYFSDVSYECAPYADFVYQSGIMNGVGGGMFAPDSNVTYAQLVKSVVAFLGYSPMAEAKGGYPYGYIDVAGQLDIIKHYPPSIDTIITANMAASVFKLASSVPLMQRATYGSDSETYKAAASSNYLSTYMGITYVYGIITANYLTDFGSGAVDYGQIKADDVLLNLTNKTVGLGNYIGYATDLYCKDNAGNPTVIYYEINEVNNEKTIDSDDLISLNDYVVSYGDDDTITLASNVKCIYNGTYASTFTQDILIPFDSRRLEGSVKFVDNNGDGRYDIAVVDAYKSYVVKKVINNVIFNEFIPSDTIDLGSGFNDGDIEISNIYGNPISLYDITAGDIINVSYDIGGTPKRIVVTIDTYTGVLEGINESQSIIVVDGNEFKFSKFLADNPNSDYLNLELGTKVTLYFNKGAKVSDIRVNDPLYKIGYLCDVKETSGLDSLWMFKIFNQDAEFETLTLAKKLYTSESARAVSASDVVASLPGYWAGSLRQPILYTTNSNGEIDWIDYSTGTTARDGIYVIDGFDNSGDTVYYSQSQHNFGGRLIVDDTTLIFNVPKDNKADDWENYYIESSSYFSEGDRKIDFTAYGLDEQNSPCAAIVVRKDGVKNVSANGDLLVVDTITKVISQDEEKYKLSCYMSGSMKTYFADAQGIANLFASDSPEKGDVLQTRIINGEITKAQKLFDIQDGTFTGSLTNPTAAEFDSKSRCVWGEVLYCDELYMRIRIFGSGDTEVYSLSGFKFAMVDFSQGKDGTVNTASSLDIRDAVSYPGYASKVLVQTRNGDARTIVIYNGLN